MSSDRHLYCRAQVVIDILAKCVTPREGCKAVVAEAYRLWLHFDIRTDDITAIVVYLKGLITAGPLLRTDAYPANC